MKNYLITFSILSTMIVNADFIKMHPDPKIKSLDHPYLIHDKAGWDEVREKIKKYDWAKKSAETYIEQAEKWNVPNVRNTKDPKKGDWLFTTNQEQGLMASGIAYQLTGDKKYAEKVRLFLLRLSNPENGYPITRRACHQASVQEGHFFQHIAMAYDMALPSGVFSTNDRIQIDNTLRLFIGEERDLGSTNISNWCVSMDCGLLFCALVIQDLKAVDWILNTPGGVLDQLQRGVLDDGWWYECSISYNIWCATMFTQVAIAMKRWGLDLVNAKFPGGYRPKEKTPAEQQEYGITKLRWGPVSKDGISIKKMWDALPPMLDYRSKMFGLNDSTQNDVGGNALDIAYYVYRDPTYSAVIKRSGIRDLIYGVPEHPDGPDLSRYSAYADNAGVAVLRSQTANRSQREQIQAVIHYGDHGWYHGHFDRTNLVHLSRYGRSFYNPIFIWYSYPNYMYKFYVQTSVSKNMVVVDQKMQEPTECHKLLFHSGKMMQAIAVETNSRWSNPPYGGMVYWDQPFKTFAEKALAEGRSVPIPENPPKYGSLTDYTEPILQRRLMIVTDDYLILCDYLKGEKKHIYESLLQMKGFKGIEGAQFAKHTGQWNPDPLSAAQFVTDCDWYKSDKKSIGHYEFIFGKGADHAGTRIDSSEDGVLKFDVYNLWPHNHEIMIGTPPEFHRCRKVKYIIRSGEKILVEGYSGLWALGQVEIDIPVAGLDSIELLTDQKDTTDIFWANARVLTKDGSEIKINEGSLKTDSKGGPIKIAGIYYHEALPAHITLNLKGLNASRFKAIFGADYFVGDESQRRKTVAIRSVGEEAQFITVIEPYENESVIKSAIADTNDKLRIELRDGRIQEILINGLNSNPTDIKINMIESKNGKVLREESISQTNMPEVNEKQFPFKRDISSPFKGMTLDRAIWQYCAEIKSRIADTGMPPRAFLWIPPEAKKLRGVVIGQFNMCERPILENPSFRKSLKKIDYGCIWIDNGMFGPHFDHHIQKNSATAQEIFDSLAQVTGLEYLKTIPFIGIGHSAMADFGYEMAAWSPERAVAAISYDGNTLCCSKQNTLYDHPFVTPEDIAKMKGIPLLHRDSEGNSGRYNRRTPLFRTRYPEIPFTILADPSSTHFGVPDETCDYLGGWIFEADKVRNPNGELPLSPVDPQKGWYVDFWRFDESPKAQMAPVSDFKGIEGPFGIEGNWVFNENDAKRMEAHVTRHNGKKTVFIAFEQNGLTVPYKYDHVGFHPEFSPQKDGLTFHLQAVFTDEFPAKTSSNWKKFLPDDPENRALIRPICGPIITVDSENVAVRFDRFGINKSRRAGGACVLAYYPGNTKYKRAEIAGVINIPVYNQEGIPQKISFPELPDVKVGTKQLQLNATSDIGLPVEYFVEYGPAYLIDDTLYFDEIPMCTTLPIEVKVTAWQYGNKNEPKIQSAKPVSRIFKIIK